MLKQYYQFFIGAKIIMACRDTKTAEKVAEEISSQTGGQLVVMKLDLASLTSVRSFAADLKARETKIHMLINNAGIMMCPYMKTEMGLKCRWAPTTWPLSTDLPFAAFTDAQ
nr:retinol dehydrogenase 11-like [Cherax quadricarinatus]